MIAGDAARLTRHRLQRGRLVAVLPKLFGQLDEGMLREIEVEMEWLSLARGEFLFQQGTVSDSLFVVVDGRLQAIVTDEMGQERMVEEIGPGESIGEMGIITEEERSASVIAVRDSNLVRLSKPAFERLVTKYPQVAIALSRLLVTRLRKKIAIPSLEQRSINVAVVPISRGVPVHQFTRRLAASFRTIGPTRHLWREWVEQAFDTTGKAQLPAEDPKTIQLVAWLDQLEEQYRFILYQGDGEPSHWTTRCLHQADHILLVGQVGADPTLSEVERRYLTPNGRNTTRQRTLVLLHPDGDRLARGTSQWLAIRQVGRQHHVRWDRDMDFDRLARLLSGRAIGLSLGGGGARSFAEIGVIQALHELNVPIDVIGGTSGGGGIAALYALGHDVATIREVLIETLVNDNPFRKYTLPIMSLVRRQSLDDAYKRAFGDACIEDLWLNYFSVSCNLSTAQTVIHQEGLLWEAVRATQSLPGVAPPFIRDNHLLIDGGIVDNVPGGIMREFRHGPVIVVDVSPAEDVIASFSYDNVPSPWRLLWSYINPLTPSIPVPTIMEVLMRTMVVNSTMRRQEMQSSVDLYLRPPVERFGMMQVEAIDELIEIGYEYTLSQRDKLKRFSWQGTKMETMTFNE
ncbi:MAG: patatin-like phospholipase domain-containing protein [Chloroflexota bacterium]|nr:patatin-like phospholipase domain-containing protein [Chloroflexota bacterium]